MSKYLNLLSPAYPTRNKKEKESVKDDSIEDLLNGFYGSCDYTTSAPSERDGQVLVPPYTVFNKLQGLLNVNFKRLDTYNRKPVAASIIGKIESEEVHYRIIIDSDGFMVFPYIEESIYYRAYMSRITASKISVSSNYSGFNFRVYYGYFDDLTSKNEEAFKRELVFSDISE